MIFLEPKHKAIIEDILKHYPYHFYAFGSRVKGTHHRFSDLDLCYKEAIPPQAISRIMTALEESDLPFTIDLLSYERCNPSFKQRIDAHSEPLY